MSSGLPGFGGGGYVSQESRALSTIADTPGADLSQGQEEQIKMLQSHDYQIKFLAGQMKQAQKGISEANQNPIQQLQQFISDVIVLLGGGELVTGALDFGDLQYILPALGALFGFGDGPFPISLFEAAEKFFLGYVVPQQQFVDVINHIIEGWLGVLGIDKKFVKDVTALITAFGDLFDGLSNLLPSFNEFFGALGITGSQLGPLGQALAPIMKLFSGLDLKKFGNMIEFITDAIDPFIVQLTAVINFINGVLAVLGFDGDGGVVNAPLEQSTLPFGNLLSFLGDINFGSPDFDPIDAARQFIENVLKPTNLLATVAQIPVLGDIVTLIRNVISGGIPLGAITNDQPELLPAPNFPVGSVASNPSWVEDPANSRTADGTCAVKVIADGTVKALRSGQNITDRLLVAAGQKVAGAVYVKHTGYVGTGSPIQLQLVPFAGDTPMTPILLDSYAPSGPNLAWPGRLLSGTYTVPSGVTSIQSRLVITSGATGGTIWFDDASGKQTGKIQIAWVDQLEDSLGSLLDLLGLGSLGDFIATPRDQIWSTVLQDVVNPLGILKDATARAGNQTALDFIWSGFAKTLGSGKSPAEVAALANSTITTAENARDVGDENNAILAVRNNQPFYNGIDETEESTFLLDSLVGATDPPNFPVTSTSTPIAFWRCSVSATKGFITWFGKGVTGLTAIYIDLYRITDDGVTLQYLRSSPNLIGQMGANWANGIWIMSGSDRQDVVPGENYAFALRVVGSGTHTVAGIAAGWMPSHALSASITAPNKKAAVRTDGLTTNIAMAGITYSGNQMWFGFGINNGDIAPPLNQPRFYEFVGPQELDKPVEDWVKFIDIVGQGAGRGGGGSLGYVPGTGGGAGHSATRTLQVGVDIAVGAPLHIAIGPRGSGGTGSVAGSGGNGGNATVTATGMAAFTALGATSNNGGGSSRGDDAGSLTYQGRFYQFGAGGAMGELGGNPGGGGGGGLPYLSGKDGGDGAVYVTFRAS